MHRESLAKLRLDRRLLQRRGWIGSAELARSLEELPDAARKATTLGAVSDERGEPGGSETNEATKSGV